MLGRRLPLRGSFAAITTDPPFILTGPYDPARSPISTLKTQVHCHTTASDGSHSPATIVSSYLGAGYDALAITDHDEVTSQPAGMDYAIVANELSPSTQHIISTNSSYTRGGLTDAQAILDGIESAGGQAHIAHPVWSTGMTYAEMEALDPNWMGMELFNAKCVNGAGQNPVNFPGYAMARWDDLLTNHRTDIFGFAVDDLHTIGAYETYDMGGLHVFVTTASVAGIMDALARGDFVANVANFGVTPAYPTRTEDGVSLTCSGATRIEAIGTGGVLLASNDADNLTYDFEGDEGYVRLQVVGSYTEGFGSALSDRWFQVAGTWVVGGGIVNSTGSSNARLILRRHREGDFTAQVDVRLSGAGTSDRGQLMFNVLNGNYYYIVHVGRSSVATFDHQLAIAKTTNNGFAGAPLAATPFSESIDTWYTVKMGYTKATGTIRAKVWATGGSEPDWMVSVDDTSWGHGAFGLRCGDDTDFDNLTIDGFRIYYQPIAVAA